MLKVNNEEQAKLYEKRLEKVTKKLEEKLASMKTNTEKLASAEKLARKSSIQRSATRVQAAIAAPSADAAPRPQRQQVCQLQRKGTCAHQLPSPGEVHGGSKVPHLQQEGPSSTPVPGQGQSGRHGAIGYRRQTAGPGCLHGT